MAIASVLNSPMIDSIRALSWASPAVPIEGSDVLQLEVLVNRMDAYSRHLSGAAADPARPGSLCRSRSHNAIRSGVRTRSVTLVVAACQPTIRWANTSTTKAT